MEVPKLAYKYLIYSILLAFLNACTSFDPLPKIQAELPAYTPSLFSRRTDRGTELRWGWVSMGGTKQPHGATANKFFIYQAVGHPDSMKLLAEVPPQDFSFVLPELEAEKLYFFKIKAWVSEDNFSFSKPVSLTKGGEEHKEQYNKRPFTDASHASWAGSDSRLTLELNDGESSTIVLGNWADEAVQFVGQGKDPAWNPSGENIAFQSLADTSTGLSRNAIQVVKPTSSIILESTLGGNAPYLNPAWGSHQGKNNWLSYVSIDPGSGNWGIYIYNPEDGAAPQLLYSSDTEPQFIRQPSLGRPEWQNSQKDYILFENFVKESATEDTTYWARDIIQFDIAENEPIELITSPWDDFAPALSTDGQFMAFLSNRSGKTEIWILDMETRKLLQLTGNEQFPPSRSINKLDWSPDNKYILYTHEDEDAVLSVCRVAFK